MARILVTGANGWIGTALCRHLLLEGHEVVGVTRQPCELAAGVVRWHAPEDDFVGLEQSWPAGDVFDAVVHLAARVHVMREHGAQALAHYETSNCVASERVARLAAARGVRRFVFVSSIKALGESDHGQALDESSPAQPEDPYGISKLHAEKALRNIGGIELTIVRSPLVYGPGVGANFRRLMSAVASGWPLPLGQAHAPRSLVSVANLVDALVDCALDARAAGQTFHVADGQTLSVRELLEEIGLALGRPVRLVPVPISLLRALGWLTGRSGEIARLTTPLRVDAAHIGSVLGWRAPQSVAAALSECATWYLAQP